MLQPRRIILSDIVAGAVPALRRLVHDGVSIDATDDGLRAEVNADPGQIQQVLESLVRNASEAIRDAGRVTIDTRRAHRTELPGDTALAEAPADHYIVLSVADTGVGMSDSVRSHLFEPFFTTKGPGEGTGLGLASVYGIVRQSGGLVDVDSVPSVGTTFRIYLPVMPAEPLQLRAPDLPTATPARIARAKGAR
jgi:signal transduction histidine kinase